MFLVLYFWYCMFLVLYVSGTVCFWYCMFLVLYVSGAVCFWYCMFLVLYVSGTVCFWYCMFLVLYVSGAVCFWYCMFLVLYVSGIVWANETHISTTVVNAFGRGELWTDQLLIWLLVKCKIPSIIYLFVFLLCTYIYTCYS